MVQASRTARAPPHLQTATENKAFREQLTALARAGLRINESLDLDTVLQEALDRARSLTEAEYGIIALMDHERRMQHLLWSGISDRESHKLRDIQPRSTALRVHFASAGTAASGRFPGPSPIVGN